VPTATLSVFGFRPSPRVTALCHSPGVELIADLPDLRGEVCRRAVTVLPFVSGRGIKNKLLEAAAMGRPIACTPQALTGCRGVPPVQCESNPQALASAIVDLLRNAGSREKLGTAAREWVTTHHSWDAAAAIAEAGLMPPCSRDAKRSVTPLEVPHG
jgi:glycosyltransferase involved in cell wall biosynthesis